MPFSLLPRLLRYARRRFDLSADAAAPDDIRTEVEAGLAFRGANLWILLFAVLIASVGLNVNSTAVVIGAMLVSPLMGPLVGLGYGAATNDLAVLRKALKNLLLATGLSLLTSTLYFWLTPLYEAQSELLARTEPTVWDVLIALFGGMAGAVGSTRRVRGNVVPGVAIATALMPPLCTAGYGLGTGHFEYTLGALYLYFINGVFITLATFLVMRLLRLPLYQFDEAAPARRVRVIIWTAAVVAAVPSVYLGYRIVQRTVYQRAANEFVEEELRFLSSYVVTRQIDPQARTINVLLLGRPVPEAELAQARRRLPRYGLDSTQLTIRQGLQAYDSLDTRALLAAARQDVRARPVGSAPRPALPQASVLPPAAALLREVQVEHPQVRQLGLNRLVRASSPTDTLPRHTAADTVLVVSVSVADSLPRAERQRLEQWLRLRTNTAALRLLLEPAAANPTP